MKLVARATLTLVRTARRFFASTSLHSTSQHMQSQDNEDYFITFLTYHHITEMLIMDMQVPYAAPNSWSTCRSQRSSDWTAATATNWHNASGFIAFGEFSQSSKAMLTISSEKVDFIYVHTPLGPLGWERSEGGKEED